MSRESVTLRGRAFAEVGMVDACTITRRSGSTTDPETGVITPTFATIYTGKCKVQRRAPSVAPSAIGEAAVFVDILELHVPMSVTGLQPDDLATITASEMAPSLVGRKFHLRGPADDSFTTAQRIPIVEVSG